MKQFGKAGVEGSFKVSHCQDEIDKDIDGRSDQWLHLRRILQNIPGKGIATIMAHVRDMGTIIVKAQFARDALREYEIAERLKGVHGFVQFTCMFTCAGDRDYIESFGNRLTESNRRLCVGRGDQMGVIVMPYYELESLERALKAGILSDTELREVIANVLVSAYEAFDTTGFVHGDLFPKNVLLKTETEPVIIDFETSAFDGNVAQFWRDLDGFINNVHRHASAGLKSQIDGVSRQIVMEMAYSRDPTHAFVHNMAMSIYARRSGGGRKSLLLNGALSCVVVAVSIIAGMTEFFNRT